MSCNVWDSNQDLQSKIEFQTIEPKWLERVQKSKILKDCDSQVGKKLMQIEIKALLIDCGTNLWVRWQLNLSPMIDLIMLNGWELNLGMKGFELRSLSWVLVSFWRAKWIDQKVQLESIVKLFCFHNKILSSSKKNF